MYPELKRILKSLVTTTQVSESDLQQIDRILSLEDKQILEYLDNDYLKYQSQLSIKALLSKNFEDLNPRHITIKFRCLKNLKNLINHELSEQEMNETLKMFENIIFDSDSQAYNLNKIEMACYNAIANPGLFSLKVIRSRFIERLMHLSELREARDTILKMVSQGDNNVKIIDQNLFKFKENVESIERFSFFLQKLGHEKISEEIFGNINRLKQEFSIQISKEESKLLNNDYQELQKDEKFKISLTIAQRLDKLILDILKKETLNICTVKLPDGVSVTFPCYDRSDFDFVEEDNYLKNCTSIYLNSRTRRFIEFNIMFACMINEFLILLKDEVIFAWFYNEVQSRINQFFEKLLKTLEIFPDFARSTIVEISFSLNNPEKSRNFFSFLSKIVLHRDPLSYYIDSKPLDSNIVTKFKSLIKNKVIQIVLQKFNTSNIDVCSDEDDTLENVRIMKLPKGISGITLKTLTIVISKYKSTFEHLINGARFVVVLHELAHYLQRANCAKVEESMRQLSPNIPNINNTKEGGFILEEELFGKRLSFITLKQADFLMEGNYPETLKAFKRKFEEGSNDEENNPSLSLNRDSFGISLGRCGSYFGLR